jgi:hypothetical protein
MFLGRMSLLVSTVTSVANVDDDDEGGDSASDED